jgi:hypothetical protein
MERWLTITAALGVAAGCAGEIEPLGPGDELGEPSLIITSPPSGDDYVRDDPGSFGALVAQVDVTAEATGPIVRVGFELADGEPLGEVIGDDFFFSAELTAPGAQTIVAIGYDADGAELARTSVDATVVEPVVADCHGWLDLYGLEYELGPDREGVADPVTVTVPINGMSHRYLSNETARETFFMDCSLAHSLAKAAPHLRKRDIIELVDIGVYNYRCIGGGTPPDCPNGISQHAYAKGIDIAGVTTSTGDYYSVNDDWVIDPDTEPTCEATTEDPKDALLHDLICELKGAGVWNIVLTPNYNDAHRNHFHVDLTDGSDFIRYGDSVDVGPDNH